MQVPEGTSTISDLGIRNGDSLVVREGQGTVAAAEPAEGTPQPEGNAPWADGSPEHMVRRSFCHACCCG